MSGQRRRAAKVEEIRVRRLTCTNISSSHEAGLRVVATGGVPTLRILVVVAERLVLITEPGRLISKSMLGRAIYHRQFDSSGDWNNANHGFVVDCIYDLSLEPFAVS
jgi:hypothetical protein